MVSAPFFNVIQNEVKDLSQENYILYGVDIRFLIYLFTVTAHKVRNPINPLNLRLIP